MTEDALPFPFCLSGFTDEEHGAQFRDDLSIVHGNIVLADHGLTLTGESLGEVPGAQILLPPAPGGDRCDPCLAAICARRVFDRRCRPAR